MGLLKTNTILIGLLFFSRFYSVFFGILADCDEVFNYWEPLNFMTLFFGKQTWEYSPEYSIRSWAYLVPFSLFKFPLKLVGSLSSDFVVPPYVQFYLVRALIALFSITAEVNLANALKYISPEVSNWFLLLQTVNPGMSHASISLLPSTFSMIMQMFATAATINYLKYDRFNVKIEKNIDDKLKTLLKTKQQENDESLKLLNHMYSESWQSIQRHFTLVITSTCLGGILGWPFSLVLAAPFVAYVSFTMIARKNMKQLGFYLLIGFCATFAITMLISQVDYLFYGQPTFVSLNIIFYNVIHSGAETGPNIFGTEPLSYYIYNLLLNFNVSFPLAALGLVTLTSSSVKKFDFWQLRTLIAPIVVWCAIFWSQPHKEERFMYPIYPLITLGSSLTIVQFTNILGYSNILNKSYTIFSKLILFVLISTISILRIISLVQNYSSPLTVFRHLPASPNSAELENVCIGREWYHYPSSFFLHSNQRLRFVESGFKAMLPGDFIEPSSHSFRGLTDSTSFVPETFNNKNQYNPALVTPFDECHYYFDLSMPVNTEEGEIAMFATNETSGEVQTIQPGWELIYCADFIDAENSSGLSKLLYLPLEEAALAWDIVSKHWAFAQQKFNEDERAQKGLNWVSEKSRLLQQHQYYQRVVTDERLLRAVDEAFATLGKYYLQVLEQLPQKHVDYLRNFSTGETKYHKLCLAAKARSA